MDVSLQHDKFNTAKKVNANQGEKALSALLSKTCNYYFNMETLLSLFDTRVVSILNYGCGVWGFNKANSLEAVNMQYCKMTLRAT